MSYLFDIRCYNKRASLCNVVSLPALAEAFENNRSGENKSTCVGHLEVLIDSKHLSERNPSISLLRHLWQKKNS